MLNLLIVEGNTQEVRQQAVAPGSCIQGELYEKILLSLGQMCSAKLFSRRIAMPYCPKMKNWRTMMASSGPGHH